MMISERDYPILVILFCCSSLFGCSWLVGSKTTQQSRPIDPFVSQHKAWQKQVEFGNQAYQNQDLALALEHYRKAVKLRPNQSPPLLRVAQIYYQLQEYENAKNTFHQYLDLNPYLAPA